MCISQQTVYYAVLKYFRSTCNREAFIKRFQVSLYQTYRYMYRHWSVPEEFDKDCPTPPIVYIHKETDCNHQTTMLVATDMY